MDDDPSVQNQNTHAAKTLQLQATKSSEIILHMICAAWISPNCTVRFSHVAHYGFKFSRTWPRSLSSGLGEVDVSPLVKTQQRCATSRGCDMQAIWNAVAARFQFDRTVFSEHGDVTRPAWLASDSGPEKQKQKEHPISSVSIPQTVQYNYNWSLEGCWTHSEPVSPLAVASVSWAMPQLPCEDLSLPHSNRCIFDRTETISCTWSKSQTTPVKIYLFIRPLFTFRKIYACRVQLFVRPRISNYQHCLVAAGTQGLCQVDIPLVNRCLAFYPSHRLGWPFP